MLMGGLKVTLDYRYIEVVQDNHRNNSFSLNFSVRERERKVCQVISVVIGEQQIIIRNSNQIYIVEKSFFFLGGGGGWEAETRI